MTDDARRAAAAIRYAHGEPIDDLVLEFGVAASTLSAWAKAQGLSRGQPNSHDDDLRVRAVTLYRNGRTLAEVAAEVGTSTTSVSRWVRQAGFVTRPHSSSHVPPAIRRAAAQSLIDGRVTAKELARLLAVQPGTVYGWARKVRRER